METVTVKLIRLTAPTERVVFLRTTQLWPLLLRTVQTTQYLGLANAVLALSWRMFSWTM